MRFSDLFLGYEEQAFQMAIDEVNDNKELLPVTLLQGVVKDTKCDKSVGVLEFSNFLHENVDLAVGGGCEEVCEAVSAYGSLTNYSVVSWGCTSLSLSNRSMFLRTVSSDKNKISIFVDLMVKYKWTRIGILHDLMSGNVVFARGLQEAALQNNISVTIFVVAKDATRALKQMLEKEVLLCLVLLNSFLHLRLIILPTKYFVFYRYPFLWSLPTDFVR